MAVTDNLEESLITVSNGQKIEFVNTQFTKLFEEIIEGIEINQETFKFGPIQKPESRSFIRKFSSNLDKIRNTVLRRTSDKLIDNQKSILQFKALEIYKQGTQASSLATDEVSLEDLLAID